jgi:hypothetical protein
MAGVVCFIRPGGCSKKQKLMLNRRIDTGVATTPSK